MMYTVYEETGEERALAHINYEPRVGSTIMLDFNLYKVETLNKDRKVITVSREESVIRQRGGVNREPLN